MWQPRNYKPKILHFWNSLKSFVATGSPAFPFQFWGKKKSGVTRVKTRAQETPLTHVRPWEKLTPELARLCSGLNASTAMCETQDELHKRSAVERMLRFGAERRYLRNRTLNDVNLWASVYPPKKQTKKKSLTTWMHVEHPGASSHTCHSGEARFSPTWMEPRASCIYLINDRTDNKQNNWRGIPC